MPFDAYPTTTGPTPTAITRRRRQTIITSGSFTVPIGVTQLKVRLVGGGGSGAAAYCVDGSQGVIYVACGGGGGGILDTFLDVSAGQVLTATIGSGGAAVTATSNGTTSVAGNAGSATSLGALSVPGGSGGGVNRGGTNAAILATVAPAGNAIGGRGASFDLPAQDGREGFGGGGGGRGYLKSPYDYRIVGGPGIGGGMSKTATFTNGTYTANPGRANSGGGGGASGFAGGTSTGYTISMVSGAGASGAIVLEWEEPVS